jgi:hypothetical protein
MLGLAREDRTMNKMNKTRRMIGLIALVILVVVGTAWALDRAYNAQAPRGFDNSEPGRPSDGAVTPISVEPADARPAASEPSQEYDRSDLLLSLG